MKIAIITQSLTSPGAVQLSEAAQRQGVNTATFTLDTWQDVINFEPDLCIVRIAPGRYQQVLAVVEALEKSHVAVQPTQEAIINSFDKFLAYRHFYKQRIPTPKSFLNVSDALRELPDAKQFIVKPRIGNRGIGVRLASRQNVSVEGNEFIQEYFPKGSSDKRVFVVGDKVVASMSRIAPKGNVTANIAQGGLAQRAECSDKERAIAIAATASLGLLFAGVDLIEDDDDNPAVLEVNASPGFKISDITGVDVPQEVIMYLTTFNQKEV